MEKYITKLLFENDCVIVPGFGGFVTNYAPANINTKQNVFFPPSKNLAFNSNLKNNDGLLANYISSVEGKSYTESVKFINEFVLNCDQQLKKGKPITLKSIGKLSYNKEQKIFFEPSNEINFLVDSFGLNDFHSPLVKRDPLHKKIEKEFRDRPAVREKFKKAGWKKWALAAASLPVLAALAWLPLQKDLFYNISVNYSGFNFFNNNAEPQFQQRPGTAVFNFEDVDSENEFLIKISSSEIEALIENKEDSEESNIVEIVSPSPKVEIPLASEMTSTSIEKFYIIGGCFSQAENAEKFVSNLKSEGFNAKIVDQNKGLHRVSYKGFATREEAMEALSEIKNINSSAWILAN